MGSDQFPRRQVERAFRKFNDIVNDLTSASFQTWGDVFSHMMTHCERDPVMQVLVEPLKNDRRVDAESWYRNAMGSVRSMVGSGQYKLPYDDDERTALLYQFFLLVEQGTVDVNSFCLGMYGTSRYQESCRVFNDELVIKFTREVSYRLDEIMEDVGRDEQIPREAMMVFHHHDNSVVIHGSVQGGVVAGGQASLSHVNASYQTTHDLAAALGALQPMILELAQGQRQTVESALQILLKAAEGELVPVDQVEVAAKVVSASSPGLFGKLKDIVEKVGVNLASSTIVMGIKTALGIS